MEDEENERDYVSFGYWLRNILYYWYTASTIEYGIIISFIAMAGGAFLFELFGILLIIVPNIIGLILLYGILQLKIFKRINHPIRNALNCNLFLGSLFFVENLIIMYYIFKTSS